MNLIPPLEAGRAKLRPGTPRSKRRSPPSITSTRARSPAAETSFRNARRRGRRPNSEPRLHESSHVRSCRIQNAEARRPAVPAAHGPGSWGCDSSGIRDGQRHVRERDRRAFRAQPAAAQKSAPNTTMIAVESNSPCPNSFAYSHQYTSDAQALAATRFHGAYCSGGKRGHPIARMGYRGSPACDNDLGEVAEKPAHMLADLDGTESCHAKQ